MLGKLLRQGGAHMGFSKHIDTILNWTEQNDPSDAISDAWGAIPLKTGQNGNIEGKNSKCVFYNVIIWNWKLDSSCVHKYMT